MNQEQFEQIKAIFDTAVSLEGEARRLYLEQACAGNSELFVQVERLLSHDSDAETTDEKKPFDQVVRLAEAMDEEFRMPVAPLPKKIGHYRILNKIGEGGMGTVYLAEQDDPCRQVALKMIRPDMISPSLQRRFKFEVEALGRLQHPGIAHIYEAGRIRSDTGPLPYFAMEYVAGQPLKPYVEKHDLGIRERLELVACICDAAHHAHLNGIVHRDLKPENVLVVEAAGATDSGTPLEFAHLGQPKILDFGIARATDADVQMTTLHTDVSKLMGTITYMSPEQVAGDSRHIDMRSDIYALGTLLYEVLTGQRPFNLRHKSIPEAVRIVKEEDPTRLGSIQTALRGEIETIVGKALEKEPARRYGSAADLAADIRRYLANEPILAHPPSTLYELRKFARRHRGLAAGLFLSVLILIIGIVSSLNFAMRARKNENKAIRTAYRLKVNAVQARADLEPLQALGLLQSVPETLRGWEWHHLYTRLSSYRHLESDGLFRSDTATLACRNDGTIIAALNRNGAIELINLLSGEVQTAIHSESDMEVLCLSTDATLLSAWCEQDKTVSLWDLTHKTCVQELVLDTNDPICRISGDNTHWAIRSGEGNNLRVFDRWTGNTQWHHTHKAGLGYDFALSPRAERLILDQRTRLHLFTKNGEFLAKNDQLEALTAVAFSPDGKRIALGQAQRMISILDASTLEVQQELLGHHLRLQALAFSPDGLYLASASSDHTLRIWDLARGHTLRVLPAMMKNPPQSLVFSPDGTLLAAANSAEAKIWRWQENNGRVLRGHASYVYHVAFNPDGSTLASAGFMNDDVRLWDPLSGELLAQFAAEYPCKGIAFCANGTRFMYRSPITDYLGTCLFSIVDTGAGVHLLNPRLPGDDRLFQYLHQDGRYAVSPHTKHSLCLPETRITDSKDSCIIYEENELHLIDPVTREPVKCIGRHEEEIISLTLSPDGSLMASGDSKGLIKLWKRNGYTELATLQGHVGTVYSICFSPDGERIASGGNDGNIILWNTDSFEQMTVLREHTSYVHSVCFSPDGTLLASASGDGTVRIWDSVLPTERWQQVQVMTKQCQAAEALVDRLLHELKDPLDAADRLRSQKGLGEAQRKAALRVLLRKTRD